MDKEKIAQIVKDIKSLGLALTKRIPSLVTQLKKKDAGEMGNLIKQFAQASGLDNESKAILLQHLIEVRKVHLISEDHKKALKELVKQPSLKSYLQGLIF